MSPIAFAIRVLVMLAVMLAALALLVPQMVRADDCAPRDGIIAKLADRWGETLRAAGETDGGMLEIYASTETGTFTILLTRPDMTTCLLAAGQDWIAPERPLPRPKGEPT